MRPTAIEVNDLHKSYGDRAVLAGVTFAVGAGEIFGMAGRNGAGKTTTVEILQGLRRRDAGALAVLGFDPGRDRTRLRSLVGAQLQTSALPDRLRVGEALRLFARLAGDRVPWPELAREWRLDDLLGKPFATLSGGQRQRLFLALTMVNEPRLVFLDELTQGLDPVGRRETWQLIERARDRGTTVVLVTHDMDEAERLCDRVAVVHEGRLVTCGRPVELVTALGTCACASPPPTRDSPLAPRRHRRDAERRSSMKRAVPLIATEARRLVRDWTVLMFAFVFPAFVMLILAGVFGSQPSDGFGNRRPDDYYVAASVGVPVIALTLVGLPVALAAYRERGVLRRLEAFGISRGAVVGAQAVVTCGLVIVGAAGIVIGLAAPSARAAQAIGLLTFFPLYLLGGGGPPRGAMTGAMHVISDAIPSAIPAIVDPWLGLSGLGFQVAVLAGWAVLGLAAAVWLARRTAA